MGFYSCLKVHCILKDKYVKIMENFCEIIEENYEARPKGACGVRFLYEKYNPWRTLAEKYDLEFIKKWFVGKIHSYKIGLFENESELLPVWDWVGVKGNHWKFISEIKNYDNEINSFISMVLLKISESIIHCEYINEDMDDSIMFYENYEV